MSQAQLRTVPSIRDTVSPAEWEARVTLAAAYRLTAVYGMTDMIANHISCAVPEEEGHFLINPLRWSRLVGQFGGVAKLGSGCCQAANLSLSGVLYASSGVHPARVE